MEVEQCRDRSPQLHEEHSSLAAVLHAMSALVREVGERDNATHVSNNDERDGVPRVMTYIAKPRIAQSK